MGKDQDKEQDKKLLSIRLPIALHKRVVALAERERRSIHNQLIVLIEDALEQAEQKEMSRDR